MSSKVYPGGYPEKFSLYENFKNPLIFLVGAAGIEPATL